MFQCCHQILSVTEAEVHSQDEVSGCLSFQRYQKFQSIIKDRFETPVQLSSGGPSKYHVITCKAKFAQEGFFSYSNYLPDEFY